MVVFGGAVGGLWGVAANAFASQDDLQEEMENMTRQSIIHFHHHSIPHLSLPCSQPHAFPSSVSILRSFYLSFTTHTTSPSLLLSLDFFSLISGPFTPCLGVKAIIMSLCPWLSHIVTLGSPALPLPLSLSPSPSSLSRSCFSSPLQACSMTYHCLSFSLSLVPIC